VYSIARKNKLWDNCWVLFKKKIVYKNKMYSRYVRRSPFRIDWLSQDDPGHRGPVMVQVSSIDID